MMSSRSTSKHIAIDMQKMVTEEDPKSKPGSGSPLENFYYPSFMGWSFSYIIQSARFHPVLVILGCCMIFFMGVEYSLKMVSSASPPFDLGFVLTQPLHDALSQNPSLNSLLAALNTAFVVMQIAYIVWTWIVEGRGRPTIAAIFMFTCRGVLGYTTQLPLPVEFVGSGADFPVGNASFFLFFSGHVGGAVIASLDMRRMKRKALAMAFDTCNILQSLRLLAARGHYTIDLAAGAAAGFLCDSFAAKYLDSKTKDMPYQPLPSDSNDLQSSPTH